MELCLHTAVKRFEIIAIQLITHIALRRYYLSDRNPAIRPERNDSVQFPNLLPESTVAEGFLG